MILPPLTAPPLEKVSVSASILPNCMSPVELRSIVPTAVRSSVVSVPPAVRDRFSAESSAPVLRSPPVVRLRLAPAESLPVPSSVPADSAIEPSAVRSPESMLSPAVSERSPPMSALSTERMPPAEALTSPVARIPALSKFVPAAARKVPVDTGPSMVIDPSVATGAAARTEVSSKLSGPPAPVNIE
jgi:hypothetical protein